MTGPEFTIDATEVLELEATLDDVTAAAVDDAAAIALDRTGDAVLDAVRARARRHRRTGELERRLTLTAHGSGAHRVVEVEAAGDHARFVASGVRPHEIAAAPGHALPIGAFGFASSVHHPGSDPDPFVAEGVADARGELATINDRAIASVADTVAARVGG